MHVKKRLINLSLFLFPTLVSLAASYGWMSLTDYVAPLPDGPLTLLAFPFAGLTMVSMLTSIIGCTLTIGSLFTGCGVVWKKVRWHEWVAESSTAPKLHQWKETVWFHKNDPILAGKCIIGIEFVSGPGVFAAFPSERSWYW